jgi:dUTPase
MSKNNNAAKKDKDAESGSPFTQDETSPDVKIYKDDVEAGIGSINDTIVLKEQEETHLDSDDTSPKRQDINFDGRTVAANDVVSQEEFDVLKNDNSEKENQETTQIKDEMKLEDIEKIIETIISKGQTPKAACTNLKYVRLSKIAKSDIQFPDRPSPYSAYYNLYADFANNKYFGDTITIPVNQSRDIPTNIEFDISEDYRVDVRPMREYTGDNLLLKYSPITLDRDSKGELKLSFHNIGNNSVTIHNGQKIGIFIVTLSIDVSITCGTLPETEPIIAEE